MQRRYLNLFAFIVVISVLAGCGGEPAPTPTPTLDPVAQRGKQLYRRECAQCHALAPDTVIVGPSLAGIAIRAETRMDGVSARQYLELSILNPGSYVVEGFPDSMPNTFGKDLTSDELNALVDYLLTLE